MKNIETKSINPGPGTYEQTGLLSGSKYGFGTGKRPGLHRRDENAGPGSYESKGTMDNTPFFESQLKKGGLDSKMGK